MLFPKSRFSRGIPPNPGIRPNRSSGKQKRAVLEESSGDKGYWEPSKRRPESFGSCGIAASSAEFLSKDVPELQTDERGRHQGDAAGLRGV